MDNTIISHLRHHSKCRRLREFMDDSTTYIYGPLGS